MRRLPVLLCLAAILCLQVPWLFCLEQGHGQGAPLVVTAETACGHDHGPRKSSPAEDESDHHEHLLLLAVGTTMPPAVSLQAPRLTHEAIVAAAFAAAGPRSGMHEHAHAVGGAPPEVEPARTAQLLL